MSFYFHPIHGMVAVESHFLQSSLQDEENLYFFVVFSGGRLTEGDRNSLF